jgi:hypothetical protein
MTELDDNDDYASRDGSIDSGDRGVVVLLEVGVPVGPLIIVLVY